MSEYTTIFSLGKCACGCDDIMAKLGRKFKMIDESVLKVWINENLSLQNCKARYNQWAISHNLDTISVWIVKRVKTSMNLKENQKEIHCPNCKTKFFIS